MRIRRPLPHRPRGWFARLILLGLLVGPATTASAAEQDKVMDLVPVRSMLAATGKNMTDSLDLARKIMNKINPGAANNFDNQFQYQGVPLASERGAVKMGLAPNRPYGLFWGPRQQWGMILPVRNRQKFSAYLKQMGFTANKGLYKKKKILALRVKRPNQPNARARTRAVATFVGPRRALVTSGMISLSRSLGAAGQGSYLTLNSYQKNKSRLTGYPLALYMNASSLNDLVGRLTGQAGLGSGALDRSRGLEDGWALGVKMEGPRLIADMFSQINAGHPLAAKMKKMVGGGVPEIVKDFPGGAVLGMYMNVNMRAALDYAFEVMPELKQSYREMRQNGIQATGQDPHESIIKNLTGELALAMYSVDVQSLQTNLAMAVGFRDRASLRSFLRLLKENYKKRQGQGQPPPTVAIGKERAMVFPVGGQKNVSGQSAPLAKVFLVPSKRWLLVGTRQSVLADIIKGSGQGLASEFRAGKRDYFALFANMEKILDKKKSTMKQQMQLALVLGPLMVIRKIHLRSGMKDNETTGKLEIEFR